MTIAPGIAAYAATAPSAAASSSPPSIDQIASGQIQPIVHSTKALRTLPASSPILPYPASNLLYHGGGVATNPHVYLDFWGPQWTNPSDPNWKDAGGFTGQQAQAYVTDFFKAAGGSPWLNTVTQYCSGVATNASSCGPGSTPITNPLGQYRQSWNDTRPIVLRNLPGCGQDCSIAAEATLAMLHFAVANRTTPDHNAIYLVFTGHHAPVSIFAANGCGNHAYVPFVDTIYGFVPYEPDNSTSCYTNHVNTANNAFGNGWFDGFSIVGGHEYTEAITDPKAFGQVSLGAWYDSLGQAANGEIGDKCSNSTYHISGQDYAPMYPLPYANIRLTPTQYFAVQSLWSNADFGCTLGYPQQVVLPALANGGSFALGTATTGLNVQNVGSAPAGVSVQYFDANGNPTGHGQGTASLPAHGGWSVRQDDTEPGSASDSEAIGLATTGTAIVYGTQPLRTTVREFVPGGAGGTYTGAIAGSEAGTTLYVPDVRNGTFPDGRYGTEIVVMAVGPSANSSSTNVSVVYRDQAGNQPQGAAGFDSKVIGDQGQAVFHNTSQTQFAGSATITSTSTGGGPGRPLAAVVDIVGAGNAFSPYLATAATAGNPDGPAPVLDGPKVLDPPSARCSTTLAAGVFHTLALGTDGILRGWGTNFFGELANAAPPNSSDNPIPVPYPVSNVIGFGGGGYYTMTLEADGTMRGSGYNGVGAMGDNATTDNNFNGTISQVLGISDAVAMATGWNHVLALHANGTVSAWGQGTEGQLGNGVAATSTVPVPVPGLSNVIQVAAGQSHSLALLADGSVYSWGGNGFGQLGDGTTTTRLLPAKISGLSNVKAIATHGFFSLALLANGQVMSWGDNTAGELGNVTTAVGLTPAPVLSGGAPLSGITAVAPGPTTAYALKSDGTVLAWGDNSAGQLGTIANVTPNPVPAPVPGLSNITEIDGGDLSGYALDSAGHVWEWGEYRYAVTTPPNPVEVPDSTGTGLLTVAQPSCSAGGASAHSVISVQNTSGTATTVAVLYYDVSGNETDRSFNLAAFGQLRIDASSATDGPARNPNPYSVEVIASPPVAAIVEQVGGPFASVSAAYNLVTAQTNSLNAPLVENAGPDGQTTTIDVTVTIRTDPTQAVFPVTVSYYDRATGALLRSVTSTIGLHARLLVDQSVDLPAGSQATAVISAPGGNLAATVDSAGEAESMSYNAQ